MINLHSRGLLQGFAAVSLALVLGVMALTVQRGPSTAQALTDCTLQPGTDASIDAVEMEFLGLINAYRADHGLGPLALSPALNHASAWFAADLGIKDYFAHTEPNGRGLSQRIHDCGYPAGGWEGENIAAGNPLASAQAVFQAWKDSPGHNENMLRPQFTVIGIAREQVDGSYYGHYWVTEFGSLTDSGAPSTATPTQVPPTQAPTQAPTATPTQVPPTPTPSPTQAPVVQKVSFNLAAGKHLIVWPGEHTPIREGIAGYEDTVYAIYIWDNVSQSWRRFFTYQEDWLNSVTMFNTGQSYWIFTR